MRVSLVSETYPPEINGVALTVRDLAHGLAAQGHGVQVVRPFRADRRDEAGLRLLDTTSVALPHYPGLRVGLPASSVLRKTWTQLRPDAVYIATEGLLGWSALATARRLGIPACTGFHTHFGDYAAHYGVGWTAPLVNRWLLRFHRRAAATLVPTHTLAAELRERGIDNVRVLRRAVDTQLFHPRHRDPMLRAFWGAGDDVPVAIYVGRIAAEKNLDLAVRAYRALREREPRARFVWVGDGPVRKRMAAENPDFIFAGARNGQDLARHYASADVFVFPSLTETFGNVTLEAMASGLGVVAFDRGAAHEHVANGISGMRAPVDDAQGFVNAVVALGVDAVLRERVRENARLRVAPLAPAAVIGQFESLLRQLVEENPHALPVAVARI
ncbi:MAG: glycosyltransferase family 1 protein [Proteobacteria bacterium]|nr:glycosyltransferase family 1 protein [Pseudomonadota bacterium]